MKAHFAGLGEHFEITAALVASYEVSMNFLTDAQ
jgi:hypothetical protein